MSEKPFECPECGLHYTDVALVKKCQEFCAKYKACSLEITKFSVEAKQATGKS